MQRTRKRPFYSPRNASGCVDVLAIRHGRSDMVLLSTEYAFRTTGWVGYGVKRGVGAYKAKPKTGFSEYFPADRNRYPLNQPAVVGGKQ